MTTQANHTPGPWIRDGDDIGVETTVAGDLVFLVVCELREPSLYHTADTIVQQEANARLIAAAPDLLAALQVIVALDDEDQPGLWPFEAELDAARAAIRRATGGE